MKRSFGRSVEEEGETVEKQPRTTNISSTDENNGDITVIPDSASHDNALKDRNTDVVSPVYLPSLDSSLLNNAANDADKITLTKRNAELEEINKKLENELSFLRKRHSDVLHIQESFNDKEKKSISQVYSEKKHYQRRAECAETKIASLEAQLLSSQEMVKKKNEQRIDVQHQLNAAEQQLTNERTAKENAIREIEKLKAEKTELNSNLASKTDLHMNNNFKDGGVKMEEQSPPKEDIVTIAQLQQEISTKDKTIASLQKRLEKSYEVQENLKDEKREAISDKETFQTRNTKLRETAKAAEEKITKLEAQLEDVFEKLGKCQNEIDQENHETSEENDSLKTKNLELQKAMKEKNQQIAQLQRDLSVGQVMYEEKLNAEIEKTKTEKATMESKLDRANLELADMVKEYEEMKEQYDQEKSAAAEKIKNLESKIESMNDKIEEINDANAVLVSEKQMIQNDLTASRQNEQQKINELSEEIRKKEELQQQNEKIKLQAEKFSKNAYDKANEATAKATQMEANYLQCQATLHIEEEKRQNVENQLKTSQEKLGFEIFAKKNALSKNEVLEKEKSQLDAEFLELKAQKTKLQKKYDDLKADAKKQKEAAITECEKLKENNKTLSKSYESHKADLGAECNAEFQKFVQKFTSLLNK